MTLTADTSLLTVRCRVADALMAVSGHDEWTRAFRPMDGQPADVRARD